MIDATFRPLSTWPGDRTRKRQHDRFNRTTAYGGGPVPFEQTLDLLDRELHLLRARNIIIEIDLDERQIRQDGWPRSGSHPREPGIIVSFYSGLVETSLRYPCDTFTRWGANLRAIALALEALRKVARYGVTTHHEQYQGWRQLPASTSTVQSVDDAVRILLAECGMDRSRESEMRNDRHFAKRIVNTALRRTHPDGGGNTEAFHRVMAARQRLAAHFGKQV